MKFISLFVTLFFTLVSSPLGAEETVAEKPEGRVERAQFTHAIENREPVDLVTILPNDETEIHFFTDLRQLEGRTVTHRWEYQGKVMAEVPFEVGGPRWRVYSSKTLLPSQLGKWTVVVVDQSGWPLHAEMFEYRQAPEPMPEPATLMPVESATQAPVEAQDTMEETLSREQAE